MLQELQGKTVAIKVLFGGAVYRQLGYSAGGFGVPKIYFGEVLEVGDEFIKMMCDYAIMNYKSLVGRKKEIETKEEINDIVYINKRNILTIQ